MRRTCAIVAVLLALLAPAAHGADVLPPPANTAPVLIPLVSNAANAAAVQRVLDRRLAGKGGTAVSAVVVDAATSTVVAGIDPGRGLAPASTAKLLTAVAALRTLGPESRFTTRVLVTGDHLVLDGGGDPTLVSNTPRAWRGKPPGTARPAALSQLADDVAASVDTARAWVVDVAADAAVGERLAPTWTRGYVTGGYVQPVAGLALNASKDSGYVADPLRSAQRALVSALRARGVDARAGSIVDAPTDAAPVAQVTSSPVSSIVERMLTTSNNTFAEYLARHIAGFDSGTTVRQSAAAVVASAGAAGVNVADVSLRDASGLSAADRVSASTLVSVFSTASAGSDSTWLVFPALPIAGVSGTLADRYPDAGRGYVRAKTGTLRGVVSLAGTVTTADGNVLFFAFILNGVRSVPAAQRVLDATAAGLAACRCSGAT